MRDSKFVRYLVAGVATLALILAMDTLRLFGSEQWLGMLVRVDSQYFYALFALLLPVAYLVYPTKAWIDWPLVLLSFAILCALFVTAEQGLDEAWEFAAPEWAVIAALGLWLCVLEALRRAGGWPLCVIASLFSLLPLFTDYMPGPLSGLSASWRDTAAYHALSIESMFGLPFQAFANLVVGFVVFGVVLQHTGGGKFFLNLAFALLGQQRGGPAKVAIVSSGLMGSMSGSVVTNVLTTGQMTIPAMQKAGMRPHIAGGVEACASTGGVLLPPIMGSTAFIMATLLEIPYVDVATAAALPALLYFFSLYMQIDAYAGREQLAGLSVEELPSIRETMAEGWFYLGAFALLIFLLIFMQREALAPYYATLALLFLNQLSREHRMDMSGVVTMLAATGRLLIELVVILAGVGLIVGALSLTGLSGTLVNDLLSLAGDQLGLLLLMGALTSFVLGIGMTVTAAYIFLAVVLAPALVGQDLLPLSAHLFILYWAMLSFITPPVALGAYAAASIANASPLQTGFAAMRLGSVIYVIPFVFVLDPSFILHGPWHATLQAVVEAVIGVWLMAGAVQSFLPGIGHLNQIPGRVAIGFGGLAIALPDLALAWAAGPENWVHLIGGVLLVVVGLLLNWSTLKQAAAS
ncbi:MAG: TRAP transporter fused permease subunit [Pseudomonadales bacterium]|jgi:TRAP transporter 4TM/12TM fusion protein|nr:TRAP transporter fused permease subunit [Pseudomonadales bacterium]